MSSIQSSGGVGAYQAPSFNEASGVLSRIESQVGAINDLFADVQALLAEIQALTPPKRPVRNKGESDASWAARMADFNKQMSSFQAQLQRLNERIEGTYRKLGQGQAILNRLQSQDLPAAERRDADRMRKASEDATSALNTAAKTIREASNNEENLRNEEHRITLHVQDKRVEIRLNEAPDFKDAVTAFAVLAHVVGMPRPDNPFTHVPGTPASGLPPVELP